MESFLPSTKMSSPCLVDLTPCSVNISLKIRNQHVTGSQIRLNVKNGKSNHFLIDNGANCNMQNNAGQTPLHLAAANDNVLILLLLVEGHAEINPRDVSL